MRRQAFRCYAVGLLVAAVALGVSATAQAQVGMAPAGVKIDAQNVLRVVKAQDPTGMLTRQRIAAAQASLDPDVAKHSKLRYLSLNRLEATLRDHQGVLDPTMRYLAGLQRVQYVFFYPETNDIVLAGPAEGWMTDLTGRVVGINNGRPTLQLQDLVVALRAFPPGGNGTPMISCSIDPTQEGLARQKQFQRSLGGADPRNPQVAKGIADGYREALGLQTVTITGVSPETHFAQVLVEADYRMKLIGIGLEPPPVQIKSYVQLANPATIAANAMERWYFVPDYQCVRSSEDGLAMELVGDGVKLIGANEVVNSDGTRTQAARGNRASSAFVNGFTRKYSELAARSPIYAELRNVIDLSVAAAYIQQEDFYARSNWDLGMFGDEKALAVETYPAPKQVETAVNAIWKGNMFVTPLGGGVLIDAKQALDSENLLEDKKGKLAEQHKQVKLNLAKGQWWWD
ncbi:MAG: DUF1598 domain-containing protein [Pirellulales bacterium]|nr:DUF1598 domain-containing protein [Pirellulales bacterium]